MSVPFCNTPEFDASSRDFDYGDYLMLCEAAGTRPLCEAAYLLVRQAFEVEMAYEFGASDV